MTMPIRHTWMVESRKMSEKEYKPDHAVFQYYEDAMVRRGKLVKAHPGYRFRVHKYVSIADIKIQRKARHDG